MQSTTDFTKGDIYFPLLKFAGFLMIAMFLQTTYAAVDILVVSLFATPADVSAVATGGQLLHMLQQLIMGLSIGVTIGLGQKLGEGHIEDCGKIVEAGVFIFAMFALILSPILIIFSENFANLMNAPIEAIHGTAQYILICGAGFVFILGYNLLGAVFRGLGDSLTPLITIAIACVANIILDLIFVVGFKMGVVGVAYATILAQAISVISSLLIIRKRELPFEFSIKNVKFHKEAGKKVLLMGSPMALQDGLVGLSFVVITAIVNSLGLIASAGMGLSARITGFIMLLPGALSQSVGAITAQNYGARNIKRAQLALKYAITTSFLLSSFIAYGTLYHGDVILGLLSNDSQIIAAGWSALKVYGIDVLFTSFLFCLIGFCVGCGKTPFVMIQGIFGAFCIRIPFAYYFSIQEGATLFSIAIATPIATLVQIALCFTFYFFLSKKLRREGYQN